MDSEARATTAAVGDTRPDRPSEAWWDRVVRLYQANNFEIDPLECNGEDIAREAESLACDTVIVDAGGGIATFYPTRIEWLAPNRYLPEGRDFFGETVVACKRRGLRVFARNDFGRMALHAFHAHPDWALRGRDGKAIQVYDVVFTCPTSELFREIACQAFAEQIDRYDIDGIYINGLGGRCSCARCRGMFEAQTGLGFPETDDWDDLVYRRWIEWGYTVVDDLARVQYEGTKACGRDKAYFIDAAGYQEPGWIRGRAQDLVTHARHQDVVSTEAFNDRAVPYHRQLGGIVARWVRRIGDRLGKRGWMFVSSFPGHAWPNMNQPAAEYESWASAVYLNGCSVLTPLYGHLNNGDDRRIAEPAARLYAFARDHEAALNDAKPVTPVGVVWSRRTLDHYGRGEPMDRYYNRFMAACTALLQEHVPYTVLSDLDLDAGELDGIETVVLPNHACVSDGALRTLERHVDGGGALVCTFESLTRDEWGQRRDEPGLRRWGIETDHEAIAFPERWHGANWHSYLAIADADDPLLDGLSDLGLLPFRGGRLPVSGAAGRAPSPLFHVPPSPAQPPEKGWIKQVSLEPMVVRSAGGRVVHFPFELFELFHRFRLPDHRRLIGNAVRSVTSMPLEVEAPTSVEVSLLRREVEGRLTYLIGLVNHTAALVGSDRLAAGPIALHLPGVRAERVCRSREPDDLRFEATSRGMRIDLAGLLTYDLITVTAA